MIVRVVGRQGGMPTVDQSDMSSYVNYLPPGIGGLDSDALALALARAAPPPIHLIAPAPESAGQLISVDAADTVLNALVVAAAGMLDGSMRQQYA